MSDAMQGAVDSMVGTIPVIVTGGVVMSFTERMMQMMDQGPIMKAQNKATRREKRHYGKTMTHKGMKGNFSNVGF
jgi:hypothetical protein